MPPSQYTELVLQEMHAKHSFYSPRKIDTVYFGGGTPSLVEPENILQLLLELEKLSFVRGPDTEATIEINPATLSRVKMEAYLSMGINRFSVGAQTFDDNLLKKVNREHSAQQTVETLEFLASYKVNYSFDLLFALPGQTLDGLKRDLEKVVQFSPNHVSPYCLTVPEGNPLFKNRPPDDRQVEMFHLIENTLKNNGYLQYEISNFCKPGHESKHNTLYWSDQEWWGLGLSAHSYSKSTPWGIRFWNPRSIKQYEQHVLETSVLKSPLSLPEAYFENLEMNQALTDFCHTSLRMLAGLNMNHLEKKFGQQASEKVRSISIPFLNRELLEATAEGFRLTSKGILLSNQVFLGFTFLKDSPLT